MVHLQRAQRRAVSTPSQILANRLQVPGSVAGSEQARAATPAFSKRSSNAESAEQIVADPVLMASGIWKML